ncbi:hypothetical protein [Butyricimonas synergistica]|uniref:hypothetical protein n=1 Tax=Butyricimonas synergistica TaxID=544644 RepID=UPI00373FDE17
MSSTARLASTSSLFRSRSIFTARYLPSRFTWKRSMVTPGRISPVFCATVSDTFAMPNRAASINIVLFMFVVL